MLMEPTSLFAPSGPLDATALPPAAGAFCGTEFRWPCAEHLTRTWRLDLRDVVGIVSGSERIHVQTSGGSSSGSRRTIQPHRDMAVAGSRKTLYVAAPEVGAAPKTVRFDYEQLTAGQASGGTDGPVGTELIEDGSRPSFSESSTRDHAENSPGVVGETRMATT